MSFITPTYFPQQPQQMTPSHRQGGVFGGNNYINPQPFPNYYNNNNPQQWFPNYNNNNNNNPQQQQQWFPNYDNNPHPNGPLSMSNYNGPLPHTLNNWNYQYDSNYDYYYYPPSYQLQWRGGQRRQQQRRYDNRSQNQIRSGDRNNNNNNNNNNNQQQQQQRPSNGRINKFKNIFKINVVVEQVTISFSFY